MGPSTATTKMLIQRRTQGIPVLEWGPIRALAKAYCLVKDVRFACQEYNSWYQTLSGHHGYNFTVKVLKDLHGAAKLAAIGVDSSGIAAKSMWMSTYSNGIPRKLPYLNKLLKGSVYSRRIAVSITSSVELFRVKPSMDITSITKPFSGSKPEVAIWSQWIRDYSHKHWTKLVTTDESPNLYHTSTSAGPNGGASLLSAGIDALALKACPTTWILFKQMCLFSKRFDLVRRAVLTEREINLKLKEGFQLPKRVLKEGGLHLARLLYLPDKAGKTRVVYCLTWWIQELLEPFHNELYRLLRSIPQDGTRSHDEASKIVRTWTAAGRRLWSVDLSNATDRFPLELQVAMVEGLKGKVFAGLWRRAMGIKPWHSGTNEYVRYEVGQPMGSKTSWAAFALTHHTILRILCQYHRINEIAYVIIGDDIVIANDKVANSYIGLLNDIGVDFSPSKTISPDKANSSVAEFAKRIFRDGVEYSPLTSNLLKEIFVNRDYPVFESLMRELETKWGEGVSVCQDNIVLQPPANALYNLLPKKEKEKFAVYTGHLGVSGLPEGITHYVNHLSGVLDNPWKGIDQYTFRVVLYNSISDVLSGYLVKLIKIKEAFPPGGTCEAQVWDGLYLVPNHPFYAVISRIEEVVLDCSRGLADGDLNLQRVTDLGLDLGYLIELATHGRSWSSYKRLLNRRATASARFWNTVYKNCKNPEELYW